VPPYRSSQLAAIALVSSNGDVVIQASSRVYQELLSFSESNGRKGHFRRHTMQSVQIALEKLGPSNEERGVHGACGVATPLLPLI
jgi:hypothetical protein